MYALLMPALDTASDKSLEFLYNFVKSGVASVILEMLTKQNFLPHADVATERYLITVLNLMINITSLCHNTLLP